AEGLAKRGNLSKSLQSLQATPVSPASPEVLEALRTRHPPASQPLPEWLHAATAENPPAIEARDFRRIIAKLPNGVGAGPSGTTFEHLRDAALGNAEVFTHLLALTNTALAGKLPAVAGELLTASRLLAFTKPHGGTRPIAVGECLLRIIAKAALFLITPAARSHFVPLQFGVAVAGGIEAAIHTTPAHPQVVLLAYADDITLLGDASACAAAFDHLTAALASMGLLHNPAKCAAWSAAPIDPASVPPGITVSTEGLQILGSPVGTTQGCAAAVRDRLTAAAEPLPLLAQMDPQLCLLLLTRCVSRRASFLARTTPLEVLPTAEWSAWGERLLHAFLEAAHIVAPRSNAERRRIWRQAALPVTLGGLGITDPAVEGSYAYLASVVGAAHLLHSLADSLHPAIAALLPLMDSAPDSAAALPSRLAAAEAALPPDGLEALQAVPPRCLISLPCCFWSTVAMRLPLPPLPDHSLVRIYWAAAAGSREEQWEQPAQTQRVWKGAMERMVAAADGADATAGGVGACRAALQMTLQEGNSTQRGPSSTRFSFMHSSVVASTLLLSRCSLHLLSYFLSLPLSPPLPAPSPPPSSHLLSLYPSPSSNANSMGVEWCDASLARHSTLVRSFAGSTLHSGEQLHWLNTPLWCGFTGSTLHSGVASLARHSTLLHWLDTPLWCGFTGSTLHSGVASLARHSTLVSSFTGSTLHSGEQLHWLDTPLWCGFTGSTLHSGEQLHWLDTPLCFTGSTLHSGEQLHWLDTPLWCGFTRNPTLTTGQRLTTESSGAEDKGEETEEEKRKQGRKRGSRGGEEEAEEERKQRRRRGSRGGGEEAEEEERKQRRRRGCFCRRGKISLAVHSYRPPPFVFARTAYLISSLSPPPLPFVLQPSTTGELQQQQQYQAATGKGESAEPSSRGIDGSGGMDGSNGMRRTSGTAKSDKADHPLFMMRQNWTPCIAPSPSPPCNTPPPVTHPPQQLPA
ncbi:unnamed protein product, partial [Closterium sp. Naga37s-1]